MTSDVIVAFITGSIAAFITSMCTLLGNNKKYISDNIIQERAKWREDIRDLSKKISNCILDNKRDKIVEFQNELMLKLNPLDKNDQEIIDVINKYKNDINISNSRIADEFNSKMSLLLKHDWDRAKNENSIFTKYFIKIVRVPYSDFSELKEVKEKQFIIQPLLVTLCFFSLLIIGYFFAINPLMDFLDIHSIKDIKKFVFFLSFIFSSFGTLIVLIIILIMSSNKKKKLA